MIAVSFATTKRRISFKSRGLNPSFHANSTGANQNFAAGGTSGNSERFVQIQGDQA
jgi:hypothetical protein